MTTDCLTLGLEHKLKLWAVDPRVQALLQMSGRQGGKQAVERFCTWTACLLPAAWLAGCPAEAAV